MRSSNGVSDARSSSLTWLSIIFLSLFRCAVTIATGMFSLILSISISSSSILVYLSVPSICRTRCLNVWVDRVVKRCQDPSMQSMFEATDRVLIELGWTDPSKRSQCIRSLSQGQLHSYVSKNAWMFTSSHAPIATKHVAIPLSKWPLSMYPDLVPHAARITGAFIEDIIARCATTMSRNELIRPQGISTDINGHE